MPPLPTALQAGYYYDSDGDGFDDTYVPDPWEDPAYYGYTTPPADQDGDGWEDALDPFPADARLNPQTDPDADGVPSELEWFYGMNDLDPADGAADLDGDGFSNAEAFQQGWVLDAALVSPVPDLDGDRLNDITEAHWAQVHPGSLDPGNPLDPVADYDQDGVMNFEELTWGLDLASPTSPATGEDLAFMQLATGDYTAFVTPGYPGYSATDPDADGLPSLLEYQLLLNPRSADSDEDGVPDGEEDSDGDGFGNLAEVAAGTLPGQAASHPVASSAGGTGGDGSGSTSGNGNEQGNGNGTTGSAVPPVGGTALAATTDLHLRVRSLKVSGGTITRHSPEEWIYTSGSANQSEDMAALTADGWLVDFYTTEVPTGTDPDGLPIGFETWYWWTARKQSGVDGETIVPFGGPSGVIASDQAVSEAYADEPGQVYQGDVSGELNLNDPASGDVFTGWEEGGGVEVVSEFAASKQSTPVSDTGLYPQGEAAEVWVEGSAPEVAQRRTYLILTSSTAFQAEPDWQGAGTVTFILEPGMTGIGRVEATTSAAPWVTVHNGRLWVEPPVEQGMKNVVRLLPVELAPEKLASNGDFDEGDTGSTDAQETGAISDNRNHTLIAKRNSVDGRVSAGDVVTDDLHQGWFGIRPGVMPDDFFNGATVTITKKNKTDPDTGKRETGQVRFFATWGTNQELMIQPDDPFIDYLLTNNPAPRNLVGKVYGTNKTVPSGATFWIEGVSPGKITLEYRIQKGSTDIKHEQTFDVRTEWTKAQWLAVVRDEIHLDSFTSSGGACKNGFSETGIDTNQYVVANDFLPNRPYIYSVYEYYAKLHDRGDGQTATGGRDKFLWAGLAKLAGCPIYGGLSDAQNGRSGLAIASFGIVQESILKGIQDLLISANIKIYNDLAYQFVAYRTGGIKSIEHLKKLGTIDTSNYNAWKAIDEAGAAEIANANQVLLRREQEIILADTYTDLLSLWDGWVADAFSWLTRNPIPGGPAFQTVIPNGNIAVFADRWAWITDPQQGMWLLWTGKDKYDRESLAYVPLRTGAAHFAFFSRYSSAPLR